MTNSLEQILFDAVEAVNVDLPEKMRLQKSLSENLLNDEGSIDSMGVVILLTEFESRVSQAFNIEFEFGEKIDSTLTENPYDTLGSLLRYITNLLDKNY